jgi:carbonic anhydrase
MSAPAQRLSSQIFSQLRQNRFFLLISALTAYVFSAATPVTALAQQQQDGGAPDWSYSGANGPEHWGDLSADFATCKNGLYQSPINIDTAKKADVGELQFHYTASPLDIVNNGRTIQINYRPGSAVEIGGARYELVQFHFHRPSEERIKGKRYPMVAHLAHRAQDGKLLVVAVLIKRGRQNALLEDLWKNLPAQEGTENAPGNVQVNAEDLLPTKRGYYNFLGSLTIPPCTEGVAWYVLKQPIEASRSQIARFARIYPHNARPTQPLDGRVVLQTK